MGCSRRHFEQIYSVDDNGKRPWTSCWVGTTKGWTCGAGLYEMERSDGPSLETLEDEDQGYFVVSGKPANLEQYAVRRGSYLLLASGRFTLRFDFFH